MHMALTHRTSPNKCNSLVTALRRCISYGASYRDLSTHAVLAVFELETRIIANHYEQEIWYPPRPLEV